MFAVGVVKQCQCCPKRMRQRCTVLAGSGGMLPQKFSGEVLIWCILAECRANFQGFNLG